MLINNSGKIKNDGLNSRVTCSLDQFVNHFQNLNIDQELQIEPDLKLPELENYYY